MFVFFSVFASTACANSLVTPVDATAQSYWSNKGLDWRSPVNTINGSGMTLPVTRESTSFSEHQFEFGMWLSNTGTAKSTWIMFDMGEEMTLTGLRVWNYNEPFLNKIDYTARGIKSCELRYGGAAMLANGDTYINAGAWGTFAETLTFARATGKDGLEGEDIKFSTPITTRYVMLRVLENYGDKDHTGLSEVRFYGRKIQRWYLEGDSSSTEFNTVRSDDLLQTAVASVDNNLTINSKNSGLTVNTTTYQENDISWLSDGSFGPVGAVGGLCIQGGTVTYNFDVSIKPDGYDISEVCVYTGWNSSGGRENPSYSLYCKRVGDSDFTPVGVGYYLCTITGSNNRHAYLKMKNLDLKGVAALRFAFHGDSNGRGQQNFGVGYKEIDVFQNCGSAAVSPVAATAQSAWNARKPINTINGENLLPSKWPTGSEVAIDTNAEKMWLSNNSKETWIAFDLGEECTVKGFHLWNYNEYSENTTKWQNRGMKTADIYIGTTMPADGGSYASAGAAWGTFVQGMTFLRAPASSSYMGEDYAFNKPVRGRYFQFKVTSSYAGAAPSNLSDNYVGLGAIVFYCDVEEVVTRGSSGTKTISGSHGRVVTVKDGAGTAAPITLASETTRIHTLRGETFEGVSQVDAKEKTLELGKIELPYGTAGLEILPQGTLTCVEGVRNWMEWKLDADLFLHGALSDNAKGGVSLEKTGKGTVVFDGIDSRQGTTTYNGGTYRQTGGVSDTPGATFNNSVCEFSAGTSRATSGMEFNSSEVSVSGTHIADWKNVSVFSDKSSLAVKNGGILKFGRIMSSPSEFKITLDGGTLGTSAFGIDVPWLSFNECSIVIGEKGATFDTSERSAVLDLDVLNVIGGKISKTGDNTLTLRRRVNGAGDISVEKGTLALSCSPIIHYDFNNISGNKVPNLGTGGAALDGVISGSPGVVEGVEGNALSFCSSANGVATAGSVSMRQFTYAAWVKSAGSSSQDQRIIIGGPYVQNSEQFLGYLGTDNDRYWVFARDGHEYGVSTISIDTENWHHLAATYDGINVILYIDGVAVQTKTLTQNKNVCTMRIGFGNNVTPNGEFWNGLMDEAYVFDRALSADEVAKLKEDSWRTVNILDPESDLSIANGATLVLDGVDQTVSTLTIDGRLQCLGETTWGAIGSGAENETPRITGNGILRVKGPRKFGTKIIVR
jgi:hypothetical protein